mmetsp:Transcript_34332/g.103580  ORF Transcript_34332/g.103580 Transcript_34332/m.103580 type:complete len:675 (+) Transcript_34332:121-2145(+)
MIMQHELRLAPQRRGSSSVKVEEPKVTIVTEVSEFVAIPIVKFHLRKEAVTQALYQVVISLYLSGGNAFSGEIADVDGFIKLAGDVLFAAFYLGAAATFTGAYYCWDEITRKQRMPYVHPSVFTDGWMKFVPHDVPKICGSQLPLLSLTMGIFWGITLGGVFLLAILLIWLASGTDMNASINGWGYTIVKSVYYGIFGYFMLFVAFVHGSSHIPPAVLMAYEESTFGSQLALAAHGRGQKLMHKRNSFTVKRETLSEMVDTPSEVGESLTLKHQQWCCGCILCAVLVQLAATGNALYEGPGLKMGRAEGIRFMAAEMCATTFLNAFMVSLTSMVFYMEIEAGDLPYLNPICFKKGLLRTFPFQFNEPAKHLRRCLTNGLWWTGVFGGMAVAGLLVVSGVAMGAMAHLGVSYTIKIAGWYWIFIRVPMAGLLAGGVMLMCVLQMCADVPPAILKEHARIRLAERDKKLRDELREDAASRRYNNPEMPSRSQQQVVSCSKREDIELETWEADQTEEGSGAHHLTFGDYSTGLIKTSERHCDPTCHDKHVYVRFMGFKLFNVQASHPCIQYIEGTKSRRHVKRTLATKEDHLSSEDEAKDVGQISFGDYEQDKLNTSGCVKNRGLKCTQYQEIMVVKLMHRNLWEVHESHSSHQMLRNWHKQLGGDQNPFQPNLDKN